jgi:hypothetical protein
MKWEVSDEKEYIIIYREAMRPDLSFPTPRLQAIMILHAFLFQDGFSKQLRILWKKIRARL